MARAWWCAEIAVVELGDIQYLTTKKTAPNSTWRPCTRGLGGGASAGPAMTIVTDELIRTVGFSVASGMFR
jgi:hypothetical protein